MMTRWKAHLPLLRIFGLILALLYLAGLLIASAERESNASKLIDASWQWAPAAGFEPSSVPPAEGWQKYTGPVGLEHGYYWLRVPIPRKAWKDPTLFMLQVGGNQVYAGGQLLYRNDPVAMGVRVNSGFYWHMTALPLPLPDHVDLLLRNGILKTQHPTIVLGEKAAIVSQIFHQDLDNVLLGSLLLFCCLAAIGLYVSQRDRMYLYFSLLALCGGYASLVGNQLIKFVWSNPWVSFLQETAMPWATFAVNGILLTVFPDVNRRTVRVMHAFLLAFSVFATVSAVSSVYLYTFWTTYLYTPVFLVMFVIAYWTIWSAYRSRRDVESVWIMAGFTSLVAVAFVHVVRYWLPPSLSERWRALLDELNRLPADLLYLALFAFVVCLIRVIIYRYTSMNRQLTELNRSLEQLVAARTAELQHSNRQLEDANEHLSASLKESAEAMAETMMLEERHRITGAIHDTVGHTLSAAIIQLEAARRLLPVDRQQAEEKLAASQRLARQGLEDIRQSVRLLREDKEHYDLPAAIGALIRETEAAEGCAIECEIGKLPETLTVLQKKIIFQALQEGLSSGVRRAAARRFRVELTAEAGAVRLQLQRDGTPLPEADGLGLGLQAVAERASRLGGELKVGQAAHSAVLILSLPA